MEIIIETERLILRKIELSDQQSMFELDSDNDVHKYLGEPVVKTIEESILKINNINEQYINNGVGRLAVIEKSTNLFLGWSGLKLEEPRKHHNQKYYDIGYRLIKKYWGKGYATESAKACLDYGFNNLNLIEIYADVDSNNIVSKNVLEKIGLKYLFTFDDDGFHTDWYKVTKNQYS